ncbi:MAG TPA: CapA family protein [Candidatus Acidoferrales bacterium]|nr:CapA family protein [Candidatus Acidoferrales bacterium]
MSPKINRARARGLAAMSIATAAVCLLATGCFAPGYAAPPQSASPAPLQCTVRDGFTLAAVGDVIISNPESANDNPEFQAQLKLLRGADVTFGNFEGTAIDIRHFPGSPQAESGGAWIVDSPLVPADLKNMGFTMMNRANNHTTDWGVAGMAETDRLLDQAGIVHAGTGKDLAAARAPQYLQIPKGRVALVGMASSFTPMSVAADPSGIVPGRGGVDAMHTTRWVTVTPEAMQALVKLHNGLPDQADKPITGTPKQLVLLGTHYRLSDQFGYDFEMNQTDLAAILRNIREGKESADFLIATIHCHEPGNWSTKPPDFLVTLAHDAIDNGADVFIGHGPHQLRGIEIYKGKPIFYSLANYYFEEYQQQVIPAALYAGFNVDPNTGIPAEFQDVRASREFGGSQYYTSVIAVSTYERGQVSEIHLYPIDLGIDRRWNQRGVPRLASPDVARSILERLADLSKPFGTAIEIQGSVGLIRVQPAQ